MRKLSLHQVYGCSTAYRNSIIGLPDNRAAFLAGSYLVILDCLTNEQRYLSFTAIEFLYVSPSTLLMGIIDRFSLNGDTRIHLYSTKPIDLLHVIEPDRFGNFIGLSINQNDRLLNILHNEPAYMITIQEMHMEFDEQRQLVLSDLGSVRAAHGPVYNRMMRKEIIPHVAFISFCPYATNLFCATGTALFKLYEIDNQDVNQNVIHFRPEFYIFTCHCWLDLNSILAITDQRHVFWIQDGSIRSDINLEESVSFDLQRLNQNLSREMSTSSQPSKSNSLEYDPVEMLKSDLFSTTDSNLTNLLISNDNQVATSFDDTLEHREISDKTAFYLDILTSNEISPHFIVSFQEYLLAFTSIKIEPFFQLIARYRLQKSNDNNLEPEIHNIHKMSYTFDNGFLYLYLLTDRNHVFRYKINHSKTNIELEEKDLYGFHAYNIISIGLCSYKPWLVTLGGNNVIKIVNYDDNNREIMSKMIPDNTHIITGLDPYGFHTCLATRSRFQMYLMANYELRMLQQYEIRKIRYLEMSHSGHLIAVVTNNLIKIYSMITLTLVSQLRGHIGKIKQVIWCKNDSALVSCGTDGLIYIFNVFTGMRESEIVTKQYHYAGIAATDDCNRIYAITSDSSIKIFGNMNLEKECTMEYNFHPSAICLSKSERTLYVGMTHGIIRIYTNLVTFDSYIDLPAHNSSIRCLLVSSDDQYLASIAESAYVLLFKHTTYPLNSISLEYQQKHSSLEKYEVAHHAQERTKTIFEYILVTKSEFDEGARKITEIQSRITELETENNLKLNSKQLTFQKHLNNYSNKFQLTMKQLIQMYDELQTETVNERCHFLNRTNDIEEKYNKLVNQTEVIYENKMIEMLSRIHDTQSKLEKLKVKYENQMNDINNRDDLNLSDTVNKINALLQSKWHSATQHYETIQERKRQINEFIRQTEIDIDDEIESVKKNYEDELNLSNEYARRLALNVSTLRKHYNAIIDRLEFHDIKRNDLEKETNELHNRQSQLTEKLEHLRSIIKKKENCIGIHDLKIYRLQQHILHVEKRKYVLDYKTKSLLERIEPIDQEIIRLKTNNQSIEQQLTVLKQQQNAVISRGTDYEVKLRESSKKLNTAKINHQSIWKIIQQQKVIIKKSFKHVEINCAYNTTNSDDSSIGQLIQIIRDMCNTMKTERQSQKQIELQGFMKEWNRQRIWLLNQLNSLTKYAEENKQSFANTQREHRKAIAPFINQLRELHNLYEGTQKKIQKRLLTLKIKTTEHTEFLQNISDILHGNEKIHSKIYEINQNEVLVETQDEEMNRLNSIIFRYQYSMPCLDSTERKKSTLSNENIVT